MFAWSRDGTTHFSMRKIPLPSFFNSVDFWSSISCIVIDIEPADLIGIKELGVIIHGKVQGYKFRPTMQGFRVQQIAGFDLFGTVDVWITVSLQTILVQP